MKLVFLDLGRRTGFAYGPAGQIPRSGTYDLRKASDGDKGLALGRLATWLSEHFDNHGKPDLLGVEHWLPPKASPDLHSVEDALRMNGVVHAVCALYGVNVIEPYPSTIRSAVCGKPHDAVGGTKAMVLKTMKFRGYLQADETDGDRADACAGWCYLEAYKANQKLTML